MAASPIPTGYHSITPYLIVRGAAEAIAFYEKAFGAKEILRLPGPGGKIAHAEIKIGDSPVMLADESPVMNFYAPPSPGATPVSIMLYVEDVDEVARRAVAAGATISRPVIDQFYGDRSGSFIDPFGHYWTIGTHKEDVSVEEMNKRMAAMFGG